MSRRPTSHLSTICAESGVPSSHIRSSRKAATQLPSTALSSFLYRADLGSPHGFESSQCYVKAVSRKVSPLLYRSWAFGDVTPSRAADFYIRVRHLNTAITRDGSYTLSRDCRIFGLIRAREAKSGSRETDNSQWPHTRSMVTRVYGRIPHCIGLYHTGQYA